jgi:hypothetical protein
MGAEKMTYEASHLWDQATIDALQGQLTAVKAECEHLRGQVATLKACLERVGKEKATVHANLEYERAQRAAASDEELKGALLETLTVLGQLLNDEMSKHERQLRSRAIARGWAALREGS